VIVVGSILAAIPPFFLIVSEGFWPILVVWTLLNLPFHAIAPVVDAATVRMAIRSGGDFGRIRVWGSIGFISVTLLAGFAMDNLGIAAFVPFFIAVSMLRAALSLQLPLFREQGIDKPSASPPPEPSERPRYVVATQSRELWRPWFVLTLIGGSLLQASQMMLMGFGALLWSEAGIESWVIGILWSIGPTAEILAMLYYRRLTRWFSARQLMLFACFCAVVRWSCFAFEPSVPVIAVLQVFHLATTGFLIMGMTNFIANWTSESIAAEAQSFFVMLRQVGTVAALAAFGYLVGWLGSDAYFVAAAIAALGGVAIAASLRMMSVRSEISAAAAR
jgi:PPP family 3-phenylpropionic acid transporter